MLSATSHPPNQLWIISENPAAVFGVNVDGRGDRVAAVTVVEGALRYDSNAGISSPIHSLDALGDACREAGELADLAAIRSESHLFAEDAWAHLAVHRLKGLVTEVLPIDHPVRRLAEYDRKRSGALGLSVHTWITANCDVTEAAAALHVHPNTLRYRLQRAEQISGICLHNVYERMLFLISYDHREVVETARQLRW